MEGEELESEEKCDPEIYEKGEYIGHAWDIEATKINPWLEKAAKLSGQKIDWHWYAGYVAIKVLGDLKAALLAVIWYCPKGTIMRVYWPDGTTTAFGFSED